MRRKSLAVQLAIMLLISTAFIGAKPVQQQVTLYPPMDRTTSEHKYDETRACFSFKRGRNKQEPKEDWDLGFSFLKLGNENDELEDYFQVSMNEGQRHRLKDLGELNWSDAFNIPVFEPQPELKKMERLNSTLRPAGKTEEEQTGSWLFAKVALGHMYLIRVKDNEADLYVLFRVEEHEQGVKCVISWSITEPTKQ